MSSPFNKIVGTGGIGIGMLFLSPSNETLGRNESRLMELSAAKDYCKQHMVLYYVTTLLGQDAKVYPIGYVGDDLNGHNLLAQMQGEGMDVRYVGISVQKPTMLSVCIQYPDKNGGNFTASNSASDLVTPQYIQACLDKADIDGSTIVAAIPEVSVETRIKMLQIGREKGAFCALSIPAAEAEAFKAADIYRYCDFLSVNEEEAQALAGVAAEEKATIEKLYAEASKKNNDIRILMTMGEKGAYSAYAGKLEFIPVLRNIQVANTTGAGDACMGGTIAGIAMGLPFQKGTDDTAFTQTPLASAVELGVICAGMAVESEDAIAKNVNWDSINERIESEGWKTIWPIK
jgi:ribokinase